MSGQRSTIIHIRAEHDILAASHNFSSHLSSQQKRYMDKSRYKTKGGLEQAFLSIRDYHNRCNASYADTCD